ncbi:hypothetical protein ABT160_44035 [Streptomyces sp. NPDC001941]|uniref:hypothetical protein n=1 Tax=Streptomyces sp. NPDC001941 TaxID=3154659 RepID=UPI003318BCA7
MRNTPHYQRRFALDEDVLLDSALSLEDLGLYVRVSYLLQEGSLDDDQIVTALLAGRAGAVPGPSREELRAGVDRLGVAGLLG